MHGHLCSAESCIRKKCVTLCFTQSSGCKTSSHAEHESRSRLRCPRTPNSIHARDRPGQRQMNCPGHELHFRECRHGQVATFLSHRSTSYFVSTGQTVCCLVFQVNAFQKKVRPSARAGGTAASLALTRKRSGRSPRPTTLPKQRLHHVIKRALTYRQGLRASAFVILSGLGIRHSSFVTFFPSQTSDSKRASILFRTRQSAMPACRVFVESATIRRTVGRTP